MCDSCHCHQMIMKLNSPIWVTRKITITEHFKAIFSSCIPASSNYKRKIPKEISITLQNLYENFAIKNETDQKRNMIYEPNKVFFLF